MIQPSASFKDNLQNLPSVEGLLRIELLGADGTVVSSIENLPGKQGSLAVYQYLHQACGAINSDAAEHGLAVFGEHTADAKNRPGAHPNIDLLFEIIEDKKTLNVRLVTA
jgi:hypothetical protein